MGNPVSIRPSSFVEGGAVPVDKNLLWKECRFNLFDYKTKAGDVVATTCAARISYVDDDGNEYEQQYSAADPARFQPSKDGKTLIAVGTAQALSKSANFSILMNNLINAGFPENKLPEDGDISILDGLYTYNIGIPEPKRSGLKREAPAEGETARERVISVPSQILRLPWEKKGKANPPSAKGATTSDDVSKTAIKLVESAIKDSDSGVVTRQGVAQKLFKDLAKDPNRDAVGGMLFTPAMQALLVANGFKLDGENISKA